MNLDELSLDISQNIDISAPPGDVFRSLLKKLAEENTTPGGNTMPMVLEPWPGGRWFRDLGDKQGHLWGFVQVIKSPTLLELNGPMFMSYPVAGHMQLRLTQIPGGTNIALRHRVLGHIEEDHRTGIVPGWEHMLKCVKQSAEG